MANPVGVYEQRRNEMRQETRREYQQFMDKVCSDVSYIRHPFLIYEKFTKANNTLSDVAFEIFIILL